MQEHHFTHSTKSLGHFQGVEGKVEQKMKNGERGLPSAQGKRKRGRAR
jgi:hypothetical protein